MEQKKADQEGIYNCGNTGSFLNSEVKIVSAFLFLCAKNTHSSASLDRWVSQSAGEHGKNLSGWTAGVKSRAATWLQGMSGDTLHLLIFGFSALLKNILRYMRKNFCSDPNEALWSYFHLVMINIKMLSSWCLTMIKMYRLLLKKIVIYSKA